MARQFWLQDNERHNEIVVRICNRVIEIDPHYAQAWATMALAQWNMFLARQLGRRRRTCGSNGPAARSQSPGLPFGNGRGPPQQGRIQGGTGRLRGRAASGSEILRGQPNRRPCAASVCAATTMPFAILSLQPPSWKPSLRHRCRWRTATRQRAIWSARGALRAWRRIASKRDRRRRTGAQSRDRSGRLHARDAERKRARQGVGRSGRAWSIRKT
jgi:hypothetical protein